MTRILLSLLLATPAFAADAFPWADTAQTLRAKSGATLKWMVRTDGDTVVIEGSHARWRVTHRARREGTPLSTVKTRLDAAGRPAGVTHVTFRGRTAEVVRDAGAPRTVTAKEDLWDGDSLEARLAGIAWRKGLKIRFHVIDTDSEAADVYRMVAECVGAESCAQAPCHHVKVSLDDWRAAFAPTWHFRFGATPSAPYLRNDSDGTTFTAP